MIGSRYRPVALPDLLAACRGERSLPPRCVLVTFDDAYREFAENAWPVLKRLGIPATLFVATGFPDQPERAFWWDRLWQSVMETQLEAIETPLGLTDLSDKRQRPRAAVSLVEFHKTLPYEEAMQSVDDLCERLGAGPARSDVLSWSELRTLAAEGVHLASHSRNHPLLTQVSPAVQRAEVEGSRADLMANVAQHFEAEAFAYPGGRYDVQSTNLLRELGFVIAFTTERGTNRLRHTDPLRLRRVNVGSRSHSDLIRAQLAIGTLRWRTIGL